MPDPVAIRTVLSVSADRAVYNLWIDAAQRFVVDTQPADNAGPETFQHDIGFLNQPKKDLFTMIRFQVQGHMLLVAVDDVHKESVRQKASVFNSNDPRSVIGQNHRTVGTRQKAGKVDYGCSG